MVCWLSMLMSHVADAQGLLLLHPPLPPQARIHQEPQRTALGPSTAAADG
jgi:hypothetical protein